MCHLQWLSVLLLCIVIHCTLGTGNRCSTSRYANGHCTYIQDCPYVRDILRNVVTRKLSESFLRTARCTLNGYRNIVCCPPRYYRQPEPILCGHQALESDEEFSTRIVGGQPTTMQEHPWTVLLRYAKANGDVAYNCAGSLLTARHVLTVAHCVHVMPPADIGWLLTGVRLGEWDLQTSFNCLFGIRCSPEPTDVRIQRTFVHEKYGNSGQHNGSGYVQDIALIELAESIRYGDTMRPICLPLDIDTGIEGASLTVIGWGETEEQKRSSSKRQLHLIGRKWAECNEIYGRQGIILLPSQLCAGGLKGEDSCRGDSGGPLVKRVGNKWYLIGLVSFGARQCGLNGFPAVYTRVDSFLDWILDKVLK